MQARLYIYILSSNCCGWHYQCQNPRQTDCVHSGTRLKRTPLPFPLPLTGARTLCLARCLRYVSIRLNCREIIEFNNSITRLSHSSCEGVTDRDSRLNQRVAEFASCWQPYSTYYSWHTHIHAFIHSYMCAYRIYVQAKSAIATHHLRLQLNQ